MIDIKPSRLIETSHELSRRLVLARQLQHAIAAADENHSIGSDRDTRWTRNLSRIKQAASLRVIPTQRVLLFIGHDQHARVRIHVARVHVVVGGIPLHVDHDGLLTNGCACDRSLCQTARRGVVDIEQLLSLLRRRNAAIVRLYMSEHEDLTAIDGQAQCPVPSTRMQRGPEPLLAIGRHLEHAGFDVLRRVSRHIDPGLIHGDSKRSMMRPRSTCRPPIVARRIVRPDAQQIRCLEPRSLQRLPRVLSRRQRVAIAIKPIPNQRLPARRHRHRMQQLANKPPLRVINPRRYLPRLLHRKRNRQPT